MMDSITTELLTYIQESPSPYHTVAASAERLKAAGFMELGLAEEWNLKPGGRYFVPIYGSTLLAFSIGQADGPLRMAAAHTDFPCFRLKPQAGVMTEGYGKLNVEKYGGLILRSWLDRPLSLAGKVVLRGADAFHPETRLVDIGRPLLTIPSLAIHMNREVNDKGMLNPQTDMQPLAALFGKTEDSKSDFFVEWLANELSVPAADILSYELSTYPVEAGCLCGLSGELISSPRLDNLTSAKACLDGLLSAADPAGLRLVALLIMRR